MALVSLLFKSVLLHHSAPVTMLLPEDTPPKGVLYLLHGFTDGHDSYIRNSLLESYCATVPLAIVMPDSQCSLYMNTSYGQPYWDHITSEVPAKLKQWFQISLPREFTYVGGISMGGYGAAKMALSKPECFAGAFLISPVTDIVKTSVHGFDRSKDSAAPTLEELNLISVIGQKNIQDSDDDLYHLLHTGSSRAFPSFSIYAGTEDFLYSDICTFVLELKKLKVPCSFQDSPGTHTWLTWNPFLQSMINQIHMEIQNER